VRASASPTRSIAPQHICLCGGIGLALRHLLPSIRKARGKKPDQRRAARLDADLRDDLFHAARGAARLERS